MDFMNAFMFYEIYFHGKKERKKEERKKERRNGDFVGFVNNKIASLFTVLEKTYG